MLEQTDSLVALVAQKPTDTVIAVVYVRTSRELAERLATDRASALLDYKKLLVVLERDSVLSAKPRVEYAVRMRSVPGLSVLVRALRAPLTSRHLPALANVDRLNATPRAQRNDGR